MSKKNMEETVKNIERMREVGLTDEEIKDILKLKSSVPSVLRDWERQENILTTEEATRMISEALTGKVSGSWDIQKIRRLGRKGTLEVIDKGAAKKDGYRFDLNTVERFIDDQLTSREELIKKRNAYHNQMVKNQLDFSNKEIVLKKEISQLKTENEKLKVLLETFTSKEKEVESENGKTELELANLSSDKN